MASETINETGNVRERARAVASALRQYVEQGFAEGTLRAGDQIPTERDLMRMFGGGRNIIRKTLTALEDEGRLERRVGSGTFVADPEVQPTTGERSSSFLELAAKEASPAEVMELRLVLEPKAAALAAMRASTLETQEIRKCYELSQRAESLHDFELADDLFHAAISAASRNLLFCRVYEIVSAVRNQTEWSAMKARTLLPEHRISHGTEHEAILTSIESRDSAAAETAMRLHLENVSKGLFSNPV